MSRCYTCRSLVPENVPSASCCEFDAATNIVSCHLPVETSLVINEAMPWDTPAHTTATLTMSSQQTAASNFRHFLIQLSVVLQTWPQPHPWQAVEFERPQVCWSTQRWLWAPLQILLEYL
ncbi:uncharacterized protein LOC144110462 [Amblyomma americanum]